MTRRPGPRALSLLLAVSGAAALLLLAAFLPGGNGSEREAPGGDRSLPGPVKPAFEVNPPEELPGSETAYRWARVKHETTARRRPSSVAAAVAAVNTTTPEGTSNIVSVLGQAHDGSSRLWVRVRLPVLPNNTEGWVPRAALGGYGIVHTHLTVDIEQRTATLRRDGREIFRAPVGIGKAGTPTPKGRFYVRNKLTTYSSPAYGPLAFGTSARSPTITDWPAGGFIGMHGTDQPGLLPGPVSHGCIRFRNPDILRLGELMPVGTPLTIR